MMGRIVRTPGIDEEIALRLSRGEPMAQICRDEHMPCVATVRLWREADPEFSSSIARAREDGFDAIASRARQTARGVTCVGGGDSSGDVQRDKLIIETDLKLLAKWDPKRYGDAMLHKHADADGNNRQVDETSLIAWVMSLIANQSEGSDAQP